MPAHTHDVTRTRTTFDGVTVQFWTDGAVTVGHPNSNRIVARGVDRDVISIIEGDVCMYDAAEIKGLIAAGRKAATSMRSLWARSAVLGRDICEQRRLTRAFAPAVAL